MKRKLISLALTTALLLSLAAFPIALPALAADPVFTGNEWTTNLVYRINREDPHARFIAYDSEAEALKNFTLYQSESPYYGSLNGDWQFHWAVNPASRATETNTPGFTTVAYNDTGWDTVKVPHSWQIDFLEDGSFRYDHIIYKENGLGWKAYGNSTSNYTDGTAPTVFNPVGTYRKHFTVPDKWNDENRSITLRFDGVESNCYVWVNGRAVGYAEDSMTDKDFDITDYVNYDGDNVVTVQVFRWSSGNWFEDWDVIRLSGIFRDVYLVARAKVTLYDVDILPTPLIPDVYGDDWNLNVATYLRGLDGVTQAELDASRIEYKLYDGEMLIASYASGALTFANVPANTTDNVNNRGKVVNREYLGAQVNANMVVEKPREWSAEHPNLYKLVVTLKQDGQLVETTCFRVGFRESKVVNAGNTNSVRWLINGSRLMNYGVNAHEMNPETGRSTKTENMDYLKKDFELMKQNNVNAIRMSHYPHDARYYDLADEYGFYIMDEANMECHGYTTLVSNNTYCDIWGPSLRDRQNNMLERSKNYACVVAVSMGNENNSAGTAYAAWNTTWVSDRLKSRGDLRPTHAQFRNGEADLYSSMYSTASSWSSTSNTQTKPTVLCEYAHAMGNSLGDMDEYIDVYDSRPKSSGGYIWDWVDQAIYTPVPGNPSERYLAFGSDWGDVSNDGNFCANGLILADRTPKPEVTQMKYAYRMITATRVDAATFRVNNKFLFTDTSAYDQNWTLSENGVVIQSGVGSWSVGPAPSGVASVTITSADFPVPYEAPEVIKPGAEYMFNVTFKTKNDTPWAKAGHVISQSQIPVVDFAQPGDMAALATGAMEVSDGDDSVDISGQDFSLSVSKIDGTLTKYQYKGRDLLTDGPAPNFWRAVNDNERNWYTSGTNNNATFLVNHNWRTTGSGRTTNSPEISVTENSLFTKVTVPGTFPGKTGASYETVYTVYPNGEVNVAYLYRFGSQSSNQNYAPEIGSLMTVKSDFENITWYGPSGETYVDRKTGYPVGVNESTVTDNYFRYIRAQETGLHVDTRWFALTDDDGFGMIVKGGGTIPTPPNTTTMVQTPFLQFNALHYRPEDFHPLPGNNFASLYVHPYQLSKREDITLRVAVTSTGVGGDNSWGAYPLTAYRVNVNNQTYRYNYSILPVESFSVDAAMGYAQTDYTAAVNLQDLAGACDRDWPGLAYLASDLATARAALVDSDSSQDTLAEIYTALLAKYSEPRILPAPGQASSLVIRKNMISQIKVAANVAYTFTSSNPTVAAVTQTGVVTGKSIGVAVIQIKDQLSGVTYNLVVNCTN